MRVLWATLVVLLIDQVTKVLVFTNMYRGESIPIAGDWLKFTYTENQGMAFGLEFGPKGLITILSIVATVLIIGYMISMRKAYAPYRFSLALILGGALGNIIDRVFYGVLFQGGGFFSGRVVDFVHVDAWRGYLPDWIPFFGGTYLPLFPIWNVADMAIVLGVVGILVFQRTMYKRLLAAEAAKTEEPLVPTSTEPTPVVAPDPIEMEPQKDFGSTDTGVTSPTGAPPSA